MAIDDTHLFATCLFSEAAGEILDGKYAVARVIMNRTKRHFMSDGSIKGTILYPNQFSGFYFDFVDGKYTRVCSNTTQALSRANLLAERYERDTHAWDECLAVADAVLKGSYPSDDLLARLTDDTLNYVNLAISQPNWATPDRFVVKIGHHSFYHL